MTKQELIKEVALNAGTTQVDVENVVSHLFSTMQDVLSNAEVGETISFVGFGKFTVAERKARTCRHPKTGETINVPAKRVVKFRPAKNLMCKVAD